MSTEIQIDPTKKSRLSATLVVTLFVAAFAIALCLDIPLSTLAHQSGIAPWLKNHVELAHFIRIPGNFKFTIAACLCMLAVAWLSGIRRGARLWRKAAIVFLAGTFSGINALLKLLVGRIRPYHGVPPFELHPFRYGLLHAEAGFSFPSGDASLAFAMAMSLAITLPRFRWIWWSLAIIVGIERIAENAHYPSDVVAGAALGIAVAILAEKVVLAFLKDDANA